jgi:hypothetical protein
MKMCGKEGRYPTTRTNMFNLCVFEIFILNREREREKEDRK